MDVANKAGQPEAADDYYNPVFERLSAASQGPLIGAVAYALYKTAKREWVREFKARTGRRPTEAEHKQYSSTQTDAILNAYIAQADQILGAFAGNVVRDERPKILADALKGSFWRSFWPSIWASFAFTAALLALVVIAALLGFGFPVQITLPGRSV